MNSLFVEDIKKFKVTSDLEKKINISERIISYLRGTNIYIYGAGACGTTLTQALKEHSIEPFCIIDRKYDIINNIHGYNVEPPNKLLEANIDKSVVIIAINAEVIRNFNSDTYKNIEKYAENIDIIEVGADVTNILNYVKCSSRLKECKPFNLVNCLECGAETRQCDIYKQYLKRIANKSLNSIEKNRSKKFDWFGYIMGQYCTLKCKHCCEHVPYIDNKSFSEPEIILSDCSKIASACEFIRYIELIGGEPFLHPRLAEVVEGLLGIDNVGYIKIFTNGTVVPNGKMIELLKNPRVVLNFSNYEGQVDGKLAMNIQKFRETLANEKIKYIFSESKMWTDWGGFELRERTDEETAYNASNCFCYNCHRVYEGILYRCPHQYAGIISGHMEYTEGEYIDLNYTEIDKLGKKLDEFEELPFTDGCKRCDMPYDCREVPAALQL